MPFVWDGHDNAQRMNDTGHGIGMHRYEWSDGELLANIARLLTDASIQGRLEETSRWMQKSDGRITAARSIDNLLSSIPPVGPREEKTDATAESPTEMRKRRSSRRTSAKPGDNRTGYELVLPITTPDRRELEERARKELQSLSGYVAKLIVENVAVRR